MIVENKTLAVFAENLMGESEPFTNESGELYKTALGGAGVDVSRVAFGWMENISEIKGSDIRFVILAGDGVLRKFRADLSVKECHGRAMMTTENILVFPTFHPEAYKRNPLWLKTLKGELGLLKKIGPDIERWASYTPDTCVRCRGDFFRVDDQGVVYCEEHWGKVPHPENVLTPDQVARVFSEP